MMEDNAAHHHHHHGGKHTTQLLAETSAPTQMAMTLQWTTDCGPLLVEWWRPTGIVSYCASLALIFGLALATEASRHGRLFGRPADPPPLLGDDALSSEEEMGERQQRRSPRPAPPIVAGSWRRRGAQHAASIAAGYALMLLAMTFNVGVIAAVVGGLAMGRAAYEGGGRHGARPPPEVCH